MGQDASRRCNFSTSISSGGDPLGGAGGAWGTLTLKMYLYFSSFFRTSEDLPEATPDLGLWFRGVQLRWLALNSSQAKVRKKTFEPCPAFVETLTPSPSLATWILNTPIAKHVTTAPWHPPQPWGSTSASPLWMPKCHSPMLPSTASWTWPMQDTSDTRDIPLGAQNWVMDMILP